MDYPQASGPVLRVRHSGQVFPLGQTPVTIGRHADNLVVLSDPLVSRHHATLFWQGGAYLVRDLGSANGTYLDDQRITGTHPLRDGAVLRLGNTIFDVRLPPAAVGAETMEATAYPEATPAARSALPIIVGLLLGGVAIVGVTIVALLLFGTLRGGEPAVAIQWPTDGAEIVAGSEIVLQASASGEKDITYLELKVDDVLVKTASSLDDEGVSSLTVSQPWTFGQIGPHTISAVAYTARDRASDPANIQVLVIEAVSQVTPTVTPSTGDEGPLPDLVVSSMKIELQTGGACDFTSTELGVRVWAQNVGAADAGLFVVELNGAQQTVSAGLPAGQTISLWFPGYVMAGDNTATVDVNNNVYEGNEENNTAAQMLPVPTLPPTCTPPPSDVPTNTPTPTPTATWTPTPTFTPSPTPTPTPTPTTQPPYDLYVRRMDFSSNLIAGETIELYVMIATDIYPPGGPFFPASHFRWRQGPGFPWQEEVCPESSQYASCAKTVYFSYASSGDYLVEVEADSRNEVIETDEGNNARNWTITVAPQTVTVNFETWPNGAPIPSDVILNGDEFLARGVRLEGAPAADSSCGGIATAPAIRRNQYGIGGNFLTTADPADVVRCNFGPVGIRFSNPVRRVTLTFAGASDNYVMEAYDSGGGFLGSVSQAAVAYGGTFEVTLSSTVPNIARVTLTGPPGALTAVTQIVYEP